MRYDKSVTRNGRSNVLVDSNLTFFCFLIMSKGSKQNNIDMVNYTSFLFNRKNNNLLLCKQKTAA